MLTMLWMQGKPAKRRSMALLLLLAAAGSGAAAAAAAARLQQNKAAALLAQTIAATGRVRNLAANMEVLRRAGGAENRRTGRLFLAKPNKVRVTLAGPGGANAVTVVSDGKTVYYGNQKLYTKDTVKTNSAAIGAACEAPLLAFLYQPSLQALAPGFGPIGKPTYKGQEKIGTELCDTLTASGTKPNPYTVTLSIGPDRLPRRATLRLQIAPKYAEVYEVRLSRMAVNTKMAPAAFLFDPPLGATEFIPPGREDEPKNRP